MATARARLRPVQPQDHAATQALFKQHAWPLRSRAGWDWALFDNPARLALGAEAGWVLEAGERIVGFLGNLPMRYHWQGGAIWGATCTSYLVEEAWRSQSTALLRAFAAQPGVMFVHSATANDNSAPVYRLFRFSPRAEVQAEQRLRWIADDAALIRRGLSQLGWPALAAAAAHAAPALRAARRALGVASAPGSGNGWIVQRVDTQGPGPDWDDWAAAVTARGELCVDRSARILRWRLGDPDPAEDVALLTLRTPAGEMRGMCMLRVLPRMPWVTPKAEIMDWALLPDTPREAAAQLLREALSWARGWGVAVVDAKRFTGEAGDCLASLGARVDPLPAQAVWTLARDADLEATLKRPRGWTMTGADSDDWFCTHETRRQSARRHLLQAGSSASPSAATSAPADSASVGSKRSMSSETPASASTAATSSTSAMLSSKPDSKTATSASTVAETPSVR